MLRRQFLVAAAVAAVPGCGRFGDRENGRLDLAIRNDRDEPVTVRVRVVDDAGTTLTEESDRIDGGVSRAFEVAVGASGRHEVTVEGDDWRGQLAWNADACALYEGTVAVGDERVEVAGECVDPR